MLNMTGSDVIASLTYISSTHKYLDLALTQLREKGLDGPGGWADLPATDLRPLGSAAANLRTFCANIGLLAGIGACDDILAELPRHSIKPNGNIRLNEDAIRWFVETLEYLIRVVRDGTEGVDVLFIRPNLMSFYRDAPNLFGPKVAAAFPSIAPDTTEASRCFALERWTASAFHAVRCLEAGILAMCRSLGIPDPTKGSERNWSNMQRVVKAKFSEKWPTAIDQGSSEYLFYEKMLGALASMQNPYRNETMHLSGKYDEDEARHIIEMVRGLLQRIAARCDENGDPKA